MGPFKSAEAANHLVWTGRRGFYENYYITFNHRATGTGFWIRYTLLSPLRGVGDARAQVWFGFFDRGAPERNFGRVRTYPAGALKAKKAPFELLIGDNALWHHGARGAVEGGGRSASWDIEYDPCNEPHLPIPTPAYYLQILTSTVVNPNFSVAVRGRVTVDGRVYELDGEHGEETHYWGRKYADRWVSGHCGAFEGRPDTIFEGFGVQFRRFGMMTPETYFMGFRHGGREYRFAEFHQIPFCGGDFELGRWTFNATDSHTRFEGSFTCRPEDLMVAEYTDPDGEVSYCNNTEVAVCKLSVYRRKTILSPWELEETLTSDGCARIEFGARTPESLVTCRMEEMEP